MRINDEARATLARLAAHLLADNPTLDVVVNEGAVWVRKDGTDFGIYAAVGMGPDVVCCVEAEQTVLTRRMPAEEVAS